MKKSLGFMGRVDTNALSLTDAFVDYMNGIYFEGVVEEMNSDAIEFEFESFINNYSK